MHTARCWTRIPVEKCESCERVALRVHRRESTNIYYNRTIAIRSISSSPPSSFFFLFFSSLSVSHTQDYSMLISNIGRYLAFFFINSRDTETWIMVENVWTHDTALEDRILAMELRVIKWSCNISTWLHRSVVMLKRIKRFHGRRSLGRCAILIDRTL